MTSVEFRLNGAQVAFDVAGRETLLETLRDTAGTTSVRYCCGIGVCGTCTVLLDALPVSSCLLLTVMVDGRDVVTAEGADVRHSPVTRRVRDAFVDAQAYQCSYCIPAIALTVRGLLQQDPEMDADELKTALGGNLCRCGSYPQVLDAVRRLVGTSGRRGGEQDG
ncbi:MAG: 2Fe-2S iron-sulfur cluster binding domain-containing protein [Streptosporangiales bacterium]|nr:2Fe-2S iron-sulfur cluster binding domain-containing protein [Streptosporangiales bacterium]MBO0889292.1 2Fe-2S iron-sulfur cluster binding domain-containing protein [Acidothermales bacterium]